jgi:hypothetical protein
VPVADDQRTTMVIANGEVKMFVGKKPDGNPDIGGKATVTLSKTPWAMEIKGDFGGTGMLRLIFERKGDTLTTAMMADDPKTYPPLFVGKGRGTRR